MIEWFTWVQAALAGLIGLTVGGAGLLGRKPEDWSVFAVAGVWLLLLSDAVLAVVGPGLGNPARGDGLEFWMYLVTAILIIPAAVFWCILERTRWSTVILAVTTLSVAVMMVRMQQIWSGVGPLIG